MRARASALVAVACLAGCGKLLGIEDLHATDAPSSTIDVPPGTPTFSGHVQRAPDAAPIGGASVAFYLDTGALVSSAVTDPGGAFTLGITAALPVDGYFQVTAPGELATYAHLLFPTATDPQPTIPMYARSELDALATTAGCPATTQGGLVVFHVLDASAHAVTGATVMTSGTTGVGYTDPATSAPRCGGTATATAADGLAYVFVETAGPLIATAADGGGTQIAQTNFTVVVDTVVIAPLRP